MGVLHRTVARTLVPCLLFALASTSCGETGRPEAAGLSVVATTTILGDVVANIVGEDATVDVLTPIGADPHDFQASAAQVAGINEADLVVANGLGLEESLEDVLDAAAGDGVKVLEVGPRLDPIPFGFQAVGGETDPNEHISDDPHVWFDPQRMAEAARLIAASLSEIDPDTDWMSRAESYASELVRADEEIAATLSSIAEADRRLVTNHDSMGYFADHYGFRVLGAVIPSGSTMGTPSSGELADLIEIMRREHVRVIFVETTRPAALAETLADELGEDVDVVSLYTGSLGEPGSGADTLIGMLETNAARISDALGG